MPHRAGITIQRVAVVGILFAGLLPRPARGEDWPCWRGPHRDGVSRETGLLKEWPKDGPAQLWKVDLGGGFSSVVVADGRLFTQTREKNQEVVVCLDAATGKDLWRYRYDCDYAAYPTFTGGGMPASRTGPRSTPTVAGDRLYTLGATGILLCLEAKTGKKVWQQDLLALAGTPCPRHGYCGCPLVVGDRIYLNPGGPKGKSIAALDGKDGSVVWQALDDPIGESTPVWVEDGSTPQVIFFTGTAAVGVQAKDGKLLWRYPWKTQFDLNIATPIHADGQVFISSNYGTGAALLRLNRTTEPETVWKGKAMQNHFTSSVLYEGSLYGFSDTRLRCVDFQTGQVRWEKVGLGKGSLVVADGQLILLGDHGQLVHAGATADKYTEVSRCQVFGQDTLTWTVPVVSGGRLFVRSQYALVALDVRGKGK
jgi:outer membrane protein assembly factor BamB